MIPAGNLTQFIRIERAHRVVGEAGAVSNVWTAVASVRAELVQDITAETASQKGTTATRSVHFRLRFLGGIATADRIVWNDRAYQITEITELGRRAGLEIKAALNG